MDGQQLSQQCLNVVRTILTELENQGMTSEPGIWDDTLVILDDELEILDEILTGGQAWIN